jgi:hypothetical protein
MAAHGHELAEILAQFKVDVAARTADVVQHGLKLIEVRDPAKIIEQAQSALTASTEEHDRVSQAIASAYLAAAHSLQGHFDKAMQLARDAQLLLQQIPEQAYNAVVARALIGYIYQAQIDALSRALTHFLQESQTHVKELENKALSKDDAALARRLHTHFVDFGEIKRRAYWLAAVPRLMPLAWLSVVDGIPSDTALSPETIGYMEPALFVLRTLDQVHAEEAGTLAAGDIVDKVYTAYPLPGSDKPARLKSGSVYVAVKVDEQQAQLEHFERDDYLMVRLLNPREIAGLVKRAGDNFTGVYFKVNDKREVDLINAIPPRFVGEASVRMFVAQVDAILRRVR